MQQHLLPGLTMKIMPFFNQYPPSGYLTQTTPLLFCKVEDRPYQLGAPDAQGTCTVSIGHGADTTRNFRWLPYVAGRITYVPLKGDFILTGTMSGCWLTTFSMKGVDYMGHIGTDSNSRGVTEDVKNAWKIAVNSKQITPISAFNPITLARDGKIFGAVHGLQQTLYALGCSAVGTGTEYQVATFVSTPGVPKPNFI